MMDTKYMLKLLFPRKRKFSVVDTHDLDESGEETTTKIENLEVIGRRQGQMQLRSSAEMIEQNVSSSLHDEVKRRNRDKHVQVVAVFSFNGAMLHYNHDDGVKKAVHDVLDVLTSVSTTGLLCKIGDEEKNKGQLLFSPIVINTAIDNAFKSRDDWVSQQPSLKADWRDADVNMGPWQKTTPCVEGFYIEGHVPVAPRTGKRTMDFFKQNVGVGVEVQFGKYSFMPYDIFAKMPMLVKAGTGLKFGIEIVPVKAMGKKMSTGVGEFEQLVYDLQKRGVSDVDIPVLVLGVDVVDTRTMLEELNDTEIKAIVNRNKKFLGKDAPRNESIETQYSFLAQKKVFLKRDTTSTLDLVRENEECPKSVTIALLKAELNRLGLEAATEKNKTVLFRRLKDALDVDSASDMEGSYE
jgi:hypothetical protein